MADRGREPRAARRARADRPGHGLQADRPDLLPRLWALTEALGRSRTITSLCCNTGRTASERVAEIGELAWLELDRPPDAHVLEYFKLLAEAGLIELRFNPAVGARSEPVDG